jgi:plasmid stability protein
MSPHEPEVMRRTTVRIDDELLAEAKAFAARHGRSLNSVVEDALRQLLRGRQHSEPRPKVELITSGTPGDRPSIDLSPAGIKEFLMQEDIEHYLEVERDEAARRERTDQRPSP